MIIHLLMSAWFSPFDIPAPKRAELPSKNTFLREFQGSSRYTVMGRKLSGKERSVSVYQRPLLQT